MLHINVSAQSEWGISWYIICFIGLTNLCSVASSFVLSFGGFLTASLHSVNTFSVYKDQQCKYNHTLGSCNCKNFTLWVTECRNNDWIAFALVNMLIIETYYTAITGKRACSHNFTLKLPYCNERFLYISRNVNSIYSTNWFLKKIAIFRLGLE